MKIPFIPEAAPFNEDQRAWLSGFLAGLHSRAAMGVQQVPDAVATAAATVPSQEVNILYGTQTGNAENVAMEAATMAKSKGMAPKVAGLDDVSMDQLAAMKDVIVVISTYGEGEMPDNAQIFWDAVSATTAPRLEAMRFGVLALGDTSYDEFCHAGKLIDTRFEQLGAKRMTPRIDCDVDYEEPSAAWVNEFLPLIADNDDKAAPIAEVVTTAEVPAEKKWGRKNPYLSRVVENRLLSGENSAKEIRHFSFALGDSGMTYEAGDALGVMPVNDEGYVNTLLATLHAKGEDTVAGHDELLKDVLRTKLEVARPSKDLINAVEKRAGDDELSNVVANGDKEALEAFLWGKDTLDLLKMTSGNMMSADEFVGLMKPLQHRAYSISSSPKAHPGEVHLTVAAVRWKHEGREHKGVASTFLADQMAEGDLSGIFMSPNRAFRPPSDDAPMIMVGPGTGVAPFRAFLEERQSTGSKGKNWLFFGDQHRADDFIYEDEITAMSEDGILNRLDLAFSRDQEDKIYVQHRMMESGKDLYAWLEDGGYFYVCGDATRMAKDVDATLHKVIAKFGGKSEDAAAEYVTDLKRQKRYLRDVY
ncbi:MAG: sulfite reductase flavoprotein subunit alpha [Pseudomonadota bacterium]